MVLGLIILSFYSDIFTNLRNFSFIFINTVFRFRIVIFIDKTLRVAVFFTLLEDFILQFFVAYLITGR